MVSLTGYRPRFKFTFLLLIISLVIVGFSSLWMLEAYQKVRELDGNEIDAFPILAQGAAMRFLLTRLYDWLNTSAEALVTCKDPMELLAKLRFHTRVSYARAYGLD